MVENQKGGVPNPGQARQEIPVRARHQHSSGESLLLDGVVPQQEKTEPIRRECQHAAFPKGQPRTLI